MSLESVKLFSSKLALKLDQGITKGESPYFRNVRKFFGNMRLVSLKMMSHLTNHNFQILKIDIF